MILGNRFQLNNSCLHTVEYLNIHLFLLVTFLFICHPPKSFPYLLIARKVVFFFFRITVNFLTEDKFVLSVKSTFSVKQLVTKWPISFSFFKLCWNVCLIFSISFLYMELAVGHPPSWLSLRKTWALFSSYGFSSCSNYFRNVLWWLYSSWKIWARWDSPFVCFIT